MKRFLLWIAHISIVTLVVAVVLVAYNHHTQQSTIYTYTAPNTSTHQRVLWTLPETLPEYVERVQGAHIKTPEYVRGYYVNIPSLRNPARRKSLIEHLRNTGGNTFVIDIKDESGRLSFTPISEYPTIREAHSATKRIENMQEIIEELHQEGIYVIGRVQVFQDNWYITQKPNHAVQSISLGAIWRDRKGLGWIDPSNKDVWPYFVEIAHAGYEIGIDEINFDYIRFPTDGALADAEYPARGESSRTDVLRSFFAYLDTHVREHGIPISADLFGMTTTNADDLGIGQRLEDALPHFDAIMPMVYPSHYPDGFIGIADPASAPYRVILHTMQSAVRKAQKTEQNPEKLRPWLQDFHYKARYTPEMVRGQVQATYDAGLSSWVFWNASSRYTSWE